jgi:hypothetical protein
MVAGATTAAMAGGQARGRTTRGRYRRKGGGPGARGGSPAHPGHAGEDGVAGGGRNRRREAMAGDGGGARFARFEPPRPALVGGNGRGLHGGPSRLLGRAWGGVERRRRRGLRAVGFAAWLTERERKEGARERIGMRGRRRGSEARDVSLPRRRQAGGGERRPGSLHACACLVEEEDKVHVLQITPWFWRFSRKLQNRDISNFILLFGNFLKI